MSWIGGDGEGGAGIHIIKSMNHQIDCLGKKKKSLRISKPCFPPFPPFLSSQSRSTPVIMALTSLARKRTKTGTEGTANVGFHFSKRRWDMQKPPKQTKITAESAFGTVKPSPKKKCFKSNLLHNSHRFSFGVNSEEKGNLGVSWLSYFIFPLLLLKGLYFLVLLRIWGVVMIFPR